MITNLYTHKCLSAISEFRTSDWPPAIILAYWEAAGSTWEGEFSQVGSSHPDDLGMPCPLDDSPGIYIWEGSIDYLDGDCNDPQYNGEWRKASVDEVQLLQSGALFLDPQWKAV